MVRLFMLAAKEPGLRSAVIHTAHQSVYADTGKINRKSKYPLGTGGIFWGKDMIPSNIKGKILA